MTQTEFEKIYEQQVAHERMVLIDRAQACATHGDRLGNFYAGAELNEESPLQYGFGLVSKQILALRDLVLKHARENTPLDQQVMERVTEYTGDIRNYMLLLLALFEEARDEQENLRILMEGHDEIGRCGCMGGTAGTCAGRPQGFVR